MGLIGKFIGRFSKGPAIQNLDRFDMILKMKDGGLLLVIVSSKHLDGSKETIELLQTKLNNYLEMVALPEFKRDFPDPKYILIEINGVDRPDAEILKELERYESAYSEQGIKFGWKG